MGQAAQDSETKAADPSTAGGTTVASGGVGSIMSEVAGFDIASYYGIDPTDEPVPIVRAWHCASCANCFSAGNNMCGGVQNKQIEGLHTYNVDANFSYRKLFGLDLTLVTEKRGLNE
jgi:hypothetical protein